MHPRHLAVPSPHARDVETIAEDPGSSTDLQGDPRIDLQWAGF